MATYDLEEQEKLIELKAWWKRYGNLALTTIALGFLVVGGVRYWDSYKSNQAAEASVAYAELVKAADAHDLKKVTDISGTLLEQYSRTMYASLGAFVSAKAHFDAGDLKTAQAQLQWVTEKSSDEAIKALARLRLVQVLIDQKNFDEALKTLEAKHPAEFDVRFAEARGDVHVEQGKKDEARSAYNAALEKMPASEKLGRDLLQLKLDALGAS